MDAGVVAGLLHWRCNGILFARRTFRLKGVAEQKASHRKRLRRRSQRRLTPFFSSLIARIIPERLRASRGSFPPDTSRRKISRGNKVYMGVRSSRCNRPLISQRHARVSAGCPWIIRARATPTSVARAGSTNIPE